MKQLKHELEVKEKMRQEKMKEWRKQDKEFQRKLNDSKNRQIQNEENVTLPDIEHYNEQMKKKKVCKDGGFIN